MAVIVGNRVCGSTTGRRWCWTLLGITALLAVISSGAGAQTLRIVATTADLASLARSVAGELAQVDALIPPGADPEAYEPRPSDLAKLRDASVLVRVGLGFDHWLHKPLIMHRGRGGHRPG